MFFLVTLVPSFEAVMGQRVPCAIYRSKIKKCHSKFRGDLGPRFTIILRVKNYLTFKVEKFSLRKTIIKSYSESLILRDPALDVHRVVIRKKNQTYFVFVSFHLHTKCSILKLRCSLGLRNDCEPGARL